MLHSQIRTFSPCGDGGLCDWVETTTPLLNGRWYATNQQLPDGTEIVVGGRAVYTVEYVPANGRGQSNLELLLAVSKLPSFLDLYNSDCAEITSTTCFMVKIIQGV
jgi:hypothetical protein